MLRFYRSLRRLNSLWTAPVLTIGLMLVWFVVVPAVLAAPANPTAVTQSGCTFSTNWMDGLSRWFFGISTVLMAMAAIMGGLQVRSANSGGGSGSEHVTGSLGGVVGIALIMALLGAVTFLAPIAIQAAGGNACP